VLGGQSRIEQGAARLTDEQVARRNILINDPQRYGFDINIDICPE